MFQHVCKLGSIHVVELSNLDFHKMVVLMSSVPYFFPKFLHSSIYVAHNLDLSLIILVTCCSNFFKNGFVVTILKWDLKERCLKNLFNKLINNILDGRCPFVQWKFLSFQPLCDFVAVATQFYSVFFQLKRYFNFYLSGCAIVRIPPLQRPIDFLKFGNKGGDEIFFLEQSVVALKGRIVQKVGILCFEMKFL